MRNTKNQGVYTSVATSRRKGTSLIVKIVFALLVVYLLYIFIGLQVKISEKKEQLSELDMQISAKTAENEELNSILEAEVDREYVEKIARDLGYVNSDEKVYESITD